MIASGVTGGIGPRGWWAEHGMRALVPAGKWMLHRILEPLRLLQTQSRPAHNPSLRQLLVSAEPSWTTACFGPTRRPAQAPAELTVALRTIDQHVESNLARERLTRAA